MKQTNEPIIDQSFATKSSDEMKILVVDDEIDSLDILTLILEQEGARVTPVTSAYEALEAFEKSSFNLIISDIGMPTFDGYTLIEKIRQLPQGKAIPAIAVTAYAGDVNKKNSLDAGFDRHISKPIDFSELITTINLLMY